MATSSTTKQGDGTLLASNFVKETDFNGLSLVINKCGYYCFLRIIGNFFHFGTEFLGIPELSFLALIHQSPINQKARYCGLFIWWGGGS